MQRRGKVTIVLDILQALENKRLKSTHILYKANLSHDRLKLYLNDLLSREYVVEVQVKDTRMFEITDKGRGFLRQYASVSELIDTLGLEDKK